jgi:hypothetical protein
MPDEARVRDRSSRGRVRRRAVELCTRRIDLFSVLLDGVLAVVVVVSSWSPTAAGSAPRGAKHPNRNALILRGSAFIALVGTEWMMG